MRKIRLLLCCSIALLGLSSVAYALPLTTSSVPVLMIDGGGDGDASVSVMVSDTSPGFDFGYIGAGDTFQMIVPSALNIGTAFFTGGSIVDFAIRDAADTITRASQGTAEMIFSGDIVASNSENPIVLDDYWQNLTITWSIGNNDMAFNIGGSKDGFAPVPEPATMLLLGTGLIGLAGFGRRKFKKFKI